MTERRIRALRNLAERPGTEAEGRLAREILERVEREQPKRTPEDSFKEFLRTKSMDDLARACGPSTCACGTEYPRFGKCGNHERHSDIRAEMLRRFPKGTRAFYNKWAYPANCPCTVIGLKVGIFDNNWKWIRVKFDHLKTPRNVPIYSTEGWHLSTEPITDETRLHELFHAI